MKLRVIVLGAGFGGLELSAFLSGQIGDRLDLTLIDRNDAFYFGFSKLDVLFGRKSPAAVKIPYRSTEKKGVTFRQEMITAIDPVKKRVTTADGAYEADVLVVALGADYDLPATPGLAEAGGEFYSLAGAEKLSKQLASFTSGRAIIGICGAPYKCPPAPSEAALLLHDFLVERGVRAACEISLVTPFPVPVPPSPEASSVLLNAFAERQIHFVPNRSVSALEAARKMVVLSDGTEMPFDLFLGVPKHCVPAVVAHSGMAGNGWIPVDKATLRTEFPDVYAIGDVTSVGTPKAGAFAEGAAKVVAASIIAKLDGRESDEIYTGQGACYIEFGHGRVARIDVDFFSGPSPKVQYREASEKLAADKTNYGSGRRARWFG